MSGPLGLALVALLIVGNGLFVAAEFSLVSLRRPQLEELAATGDRRARTAVRELGDLGYTLSAAQFGITATSLLLGFVAEEALGEAVIQPLLDLVGLPETVGLGLALTLAFVASTVTQMVVGELFPKNLAIARPLGVALAVTPVTRTFGVLLRPVIRVFDRAAAGLTQRVFRVEVPSELDGGHSLDELARIIDASGQEGSFSSTQAQLLRRAVEFGTARAGEVMVPRPDVVWLSVDDTMADLRRLAARTGHSRFPVHGSSEDEVRGTVHVKDLLRVPNDQHESTPVTHVLQPPLIVPESQQLHTLLSGLRREQRTFAVVIDEFGGTAGIVTTEDVLEVIVGDIEDEFDDASRAVRRMGRDRWRVPGTLRTERLAEVCGHGVPDGPYETVAGFVLDRLGRIPAVGERVTQGQLELEVAAVDGVRVTDVTVTLRSDESAGEP